MPNGSDIIIKGGSVEVNFDENTYPPDPIHPHKHSNADKRVTRVVITGDLSFDSGDKPSGWGCEITIHCS